jgi:DNA (cytosine-5)-methyltransferase 1
MNYATVCSGVEAMSLAVDGMGWKPVFFSEIEPFPCQLLKTRFPHVPNLGDMTKIEGDKYAGSVDVLAGGTPCQSFSVAGKRGGIEDGRGQLMLHFVKLAYEMEAKWICWENVPGVFSSNKGEDFAALLSCLCGVDVTVPAKGWKNSGVVTNADGCYGVAWRVLDAQYTRVPGFDFAVPQRRRRVWLVGYLGDWRRAAEVLFVGESLPWNFEAGERAGQEAAGGVADRAGTASGDVVGALCARDFKGVGSQYVDEGKCVVHCMAHGQANAEIMEDQSPTLSCLHEQPIITCVHGTQDACVQKNVAFCMGQNHGQENVVCYENHANDSRVTDSGNLSPTITSRCGTGGGNLPLVKVNTVYSLDSLGSNSMKSKNPDSGCHVTDVSSCIDTTNPCPSKNQGGNAIVETHIAISDVVHGDKACNGKGLNAEGAADTLDTMATQGVCVPSHEVAGTFKSCSNSGGFSNSADHAAGGFMATQLVRRLTPEECELLMAFPRGWTDIRPNGKPTPDSPRYKACGNSWAVNCARWVMMRIQQSEDKYT